MGLDVRVLRAEKSLRALDGQGLDPVDVLAAAVVALPRVPFGVLVREDAADGGEDRLADEVLGGDQLDPVALPALLAGDGVGHLDIGDGLLGEGEHRAISFRGGRAVCSGGGRNTDSARPNRRGVYHAPLRAFERSRQEDERCGCW